MCSRQIQSGPYIFGHWHNFHNISSVCHHNRIKTKQSRWNWSADFKLSFKGIEQKYKMLRNYTNFYTQSLHFRGSNVIGQINIIIIKIFIFNILLQILCRQWLPEVWNSCTSPETGRWNHPKIDLTIISWIRTHVIHKMNVLTENARTVWNLWIANDLEPVRKLIISALCLANNF